MVLERMKGVLTWAIDRYLGSIVTNVDSDALKTDLWRGNVELHGLQLRDDVLQSAGIPCVVSGTIRMAGVNASRDGSVKLTIAGVHAVVTPLVGDAARDVRLRELKEEDIRRCIAAALEGEGSGGGGGAEGGAEGAAGEGGAPAQGYLAQRISDTLMENIQLTVTDVQISYDHGPRPLPAHCLAVACLPRSSTRGSGLRRAGGRGADLAAAQSLAAQRDGGTAGRRGEHRTARLEANAVSRPAASLTPITLRCRSTWRAARRRRWRRGRC